LPVDGQLAKTGDKRVLTQAPLLPGSGLVTGLPADQLLDLFALAGKRGYNCAIHAQLGAKLDPVAG